MKKWYDDWKTTVNIRGKNTFLIQLPNAIEKEVAFTKGEPNWLKMSTLFSYAESAFTELSKFDQLTKLIDYDKKEHINILFGNVWEFQFCRNNKVLLTATNKNYPGGAIDELIKEIKEYKNSFLEKRRIIDEVE